MRSGSGWPWVPRPARPSSWSSAGPATRRCRRRRPSAWSWRRPSCAGSPLGLLTGAGEALAYPLRDPSILPLLAFTGLFAAAIPSILFLSGIRLIGGTRAGILMLFEPVVGVALAAVLLDEALAPIQVLGGVAILGAALILQRSATPGGRTVAAPAIEADELDADDSPGPGAGSGRSPEPTGVQAPGRS